MGETNSPKWLLAANRMRKSDAKPAKNVIQKHVHKNHMLTIQKFRCVTIQWDTDAHWTFDSISVSFFR